MSVSEEGLVLTLKKLGITYSEMNAEIIVSSPPNSEENKIAYNTVNKILSALIDEKTISDSYHVTGEMRALADPTHRKVCRKLWKKDSKKFQMVAWLPKEYRYNGNLFLQRIMENWINDTWQNHLDTIYLLARGEFDIYAQDAMEAIHYSVFDDDFVLMQSEHEHKEQLKDVWFIKSEKLNKKLKPKAIESAKNAEKFNPIVCRSVVDSLTSNMAFDMLYTLQDNSMKNEAFQEKYSKSLAPSIKNMKTLGFIDISDECKITDNGNEYLKLFN